MGLPSKRRRNGQTDCSTASSEKGTCGAQCMKPLFSLKGVKNQYQHSYGLTQYVRPTNLTNQMARGQWFLVVMLSSNFDTSVTQHRQKKPNEPHASGSEESIHICNAPPPRYRYSELCARFSASGKQNTLPASPNDPMVDDWRLPMLDETDVRAFFAEALTADVEPVLSDQTCAVGADATGTGSLAVGPRT